MVRSFSSGETIERFLKHVEKRPVHWWWHGSKHPKRGYGLFWFEGRVQVAHRVSYKLFVGEIPSGLVVRHRCNIPPCVNPECLELGTHADNNADRDKRGRHVTLSGSENGNSIMTEAMVRDLRWLYENGLTQVELARDFGISQATVSQIVRRVTWRHV